MQQHGWNTEFPAISDERGNILVGRRRLTCAELLGIAPVIKTIAFGVGEAADAERVRLAIISNLGQAPLGRKDRQRIAELLYGEREWTMERIAEALNVGKSTVARDLEDSFPTVGKPSRPQGGRPRGTNTKAPKPLKLGTAVRDQAAALYLDTPEMTHDRVAEELGISVVAVRLAVEREAGRREAEPVIDPASLPMTAQQKIAAALRQQQHRLEIEYEQKRREGIERFLNEIGLPAAIERLGKLLRDIEYARRNGVMTRHQFMKIIRCLHTDTRESIDEDDLNEAFNIFQRLRPMLLSEADDPTSASALPTSVVDFLARRKRAGNG
jgi:ParB-like chromosome segregation protein Spo0J